MISKELLSEILRKDILGVREHSTSILYSIDYETEEDGELIWIVAEFFINIYELAHKCKEWALIEGYKLDSSNKNFAFIDYYDSVEKDLHKKIQMKFQADTEPEAIFKACQWLLANK